MTTGFDQVVEKYDDEFVNSAIGKMQRDRVWKYLEIFLKNKKELKILELNCGTGEDAIWLAKKGHYVLATDVSEKMINIAKRKANEINLHDKITFSLLDISKPETYPEDVKFDLVFSNFGGFNCIDPVSFKTIIPKIARLLNPKGHFIAVIMPKFCLWESFYFLIKGKQTEVFRRNRLNALKVPVGNNSIDTWYYSPAEVNSICKREFKSENKLPVGFFIPPSYLNNYFSTRANALDLFSRLENTFGALSVLSGLADHFLIDMEVRS